MGTLEKMVRDVYKDEGEIPAATTSSILEEEDNNKEIKNTEYHIKKFEKKINDLNENDQFLGIIFFSLIMISFVTLIIGDESLFATVMTAIGIPFLVYIFYFLIKFTTNATERNELQSQINTLNSSIQTIRTKERLAKLSPKELFKELERHLENLRIRYSVRREKVIVGYKENEIFGIKTQDPQYSTRTHEVSDKKVEKRIESSTPSNYENEIIKRANDLLPELVGKYKSGNKAIIKRILNTLSVEKVGNEFEKYKMFQEADEWYSSHQMLDEARKMKEKTKFKVDQTIVHGDYVDDRDTIVKDSVVNRSNIGTSGDDKFTRLEKLTKMKKEGLIEDDEFKQMKKEILGK